MRCRHLTLRIDPQVAHLDEQQLNAAIADLEIFSFQSALVPAKSPYWSILIFSYDHEPAASRPPAPEPPAPEGPPAEADPTLTAEEEHVYELLRAWRVARAKAESVPQYVIAHNASLRAIARRRLELATPEDLAGVRQFGRRKADRYGADILAVLMGTTA